MRWPWAWALCAAACGGLDNRPLRVGSVEGRVAECDTEGLVGVLGGPTGSGERLSSDCSFQLDNLPEGALELFVAPTARKAALVPVTVVATRTAQVGEVRGRPGAFAHVQVSAPGASEFSGSVRAPDLPLAEATVGRSGNARIGPFPPGCFRLEVVVNQLGKKALQSCLSEGEEPTLEVAY